MPAALPISCEIVIPCFQESERVPAFFDSLAVELEGREWKGRITVVDDGSGEAEVRRTLAAIQPVMDRHPEVTAPPLLLPANVGKGGTVYHGWRTVAKNGADLLCFADADGSTSAQEVCNLVEELIAQKDSVDAVYGSRIRLLGKQIERSWRRHVLGRVFATMASGITGVGVYDSQCGAKVVKREAFMSIEQTLEEAGFVFDIELTLALMKRGYRIVEIPISWKDVPGSKVRMFRDIWKMAHALLRIRMRLGRHTSTETWTAPL